MKTLVRFAVVGGALLLPALASAQALDDQINAVYAVQQKHDAEAAAQAAAAAQAQAAQQAAAKRQAEKRDSQLNAARKQREAAANAEKQRQNGYVDQLRSLELQRQELELQAAKTRVGRENEFIDQELQQNAAKTDAIRASAESDRNISQGAKSYLEHAGTAQTGTAIGNANIGNTVSGATK